MQVSPRGYRSWRSRPISPRARTDMAVLAHIREQYRLSLGSYGRPRMTMELKEVGLHVGKRRVGRLMKINGIKPIRTRKHKVTTLSPMHPTGNGLATSPVSGHPKASSISPSSWTCTAVASSGGLPVTG